MPISHFSISSKKVRQELPTDSIASRMLKAFANSHRTLAGGTLPVISRLGL
jgi:hypothetical protein